MTRPRSSRCGFQATKRNAAGCVGSLAISWPNTDAQRHPSQSGGTLELAAGAVFVGQHHLQLRGPGTWGGEPAERANIAAPPEEEQGLSDAEGQDSASLRSR
ncbi:UNVERIFIED_CONTAM: hypothetical protein FKN15_071698 [Acipenser sinensis]